MKAKQEEWSVFKIIYAFLTGGLLISYLIIQAFDHEAFSLPTGLAFLWIIAALLGICLGRLWKDKGFLLIAAFLLIQVAGIAVRNSAAFFTEPVSENFLNGLWAIAGCYALGRVLTVRQMKTFLRICVLVWSIGTVIHCALALCAGWVDIHIINLSGGSFWGIRYSAWGTQFPERLLVSYVFPTSAGSFLSISGIVLLGAMLAESKKGLKIWYGFAAAIAIFTLGLTDTRTSYISLAAGIGVLVFSVVYGLMQKRKEKDKNTEGKKKKNASAWLIATACMIVSFVISIIVILNVASVYNEVKTKSTVVVSTAVAEEETEEEEQPKQKILSRGFTGEDALSGRDVVWRSVIRYMTETPRRLLFGVSIYNSMEGPNRTIGSEMAHCHNMIIQIFLESGLIGLAVVLLFGIYTVLNALRLVIHRRNPLWACVVPSVAAAIVVGDLAECFAWFRAWSGPALAVLFVSVGIINALRDQKTVEAEGSPA